MTFVFTVIACAAAIWVASRYQDPGAIGFGGIVIAALGWLASPTGWATIIMLISAALFVAGMLVVRSIDDWFHWGALLVSLLQWIQLALATVFGWDVWQQIVRVPAWLAFIAFIMVVIAMFIAVTWVRRRPATATNH